MNDRPSSLPRVLLIEDSAADALLVRESLADLDLPVALHVRHDGDGVREVLTLEAESPALVLLDLNMPGCNGLELLEELRADPARDATPIVVFTTSSAERDIAAAYRLRANCYVTKPRDFPRFSATVRRIARYWLVTVAASTCACRP